MITSAITKFVSSSAVARSAKTLYHQTVTDNLSSGF